MIWKTVTQALIRNILIPNSFWKSLDTWVLKNVLKNKVAERFLYEQVLF